MSDISRSTQKVRGQTVDRCYSVQMLFPHYTLHGWKYDIKDPYNSAFVLAMKARLRNSLPAMQARLQRVLEDSFRRLMRGKTDPDGMSLFSSKLVC